MGKILFKYNFKISLIAMFFLIASCSKLENAWTCVKENANFLIQEAQIPSIIELESKCANYISNISSGSKDKDSIDVLLFDAMERIQTKNYYLINGKAPLVNSFEFNNIHQLLSAIKNEGIFKYWKCEIALKEVNFGEISISDSVNTIDLFNDKITKSYGKDEFYKLKAKVNFDLYELGIISGIKSKGVWDSKLANYHRFVEYDEEIVNYIQQVVGEEYYVAYDLGDIHNYRVIESDEKFINSSNVGYYFSDEEVSLSTWNNNRINYIIKKSPEYKLLRDDLQNGRYIMINDDFFKALANQLIFKDNIESFSISSASINGVLEIEGSGYSKVPVINVKKINNVYTVIPELLKKSNQSNL